MTSYCVQNSYSRLELINPFELADVLRASKGVVVDSYDLCIVREGVLYRSEN